MFDFILVMIIATAIVMQLHTMLEIKKDVHVMQIEWKKDKND